MSVQDVAALIRENIGEIATAAWNRTYIAPNIPSDVLQVAVRNFDRRLGRKHIAAVVDTSVAHNCQYGLVFTEHGVYYHNNNRAKPFFFNYRDISSLSSNEDGPGRGIAVRFKDGRCLNLQSGNITDRQRKYYLRELLSKLKDYSEAAGDARVFKQTGPAWAPPIGVYDSVPIGAVLGVDRGIYQHYGIYIGDGKVIHYAAQGKDFGLKLLIHEAPVSVFAGSSDRVFMVPFPDEVEGAGPAATIQQKSARQRFFDMIRESEYFHLYSPEETVARARGRLGESEYSLIENNCEHLAFWCKTGVSASTQVNEWLGYLSTQVNELLGYLIPAGSEVCQKLTESLSERG